jgi:hypothetical protein
VAFESQTSRFRAIEQAPFVLLPLIFGVIHLIPGTALESAVAAVPRRPADNAGG